MYLVPVEQGRGFPEQSDAQDQSLGTPRVGLCLLWVAALQTCGSGLGSAGRHHVSAAEQSPSEVQSPSSWIKCCCGVPVACVLTGGDEDFNPSRGLYVYLQLSGYIAKKYSSFISYLIFFLSKCMTTATSSCENQRPDCAFRGWED